MLEPRYLNTKDLIAIKKKSGYDLFKMATEAFDKIKISGSEEMNFEFPIECIEVINDHVRPNEWENEKFADSMSFALKCFMLTFGGEPEKKSQNTGIG